MIYSLSSVIKLFRSVENDCLSTILTQGYNGTVLAYGQTGSGKTHTMAGGTGIHGVQEEGLGSIFEDMKRFEITILLNNSTELNIRWI